MSGGAVALSSPSGRHLTAEEHRFATALARKLEAAKQELEADDGWSSGSGSPPTGGAPRARGVLDPVGSAGLEEVKRIAPQRRAPAREGLKAEQGRLARERGCVGGALCPSPGAQSCFFRPALGPERAGIARNRSWAGASQGVAAFTRVPSTHAAPDRQSQPGPRGGAEAAHDAPRGRECVEEWRLRSARWRPRCGWHRSDGRWRPCALTTTCLRATAASSARLIFERSFLAAGVPGTAGCRTPSPGRVATRASPCTAGARRRTACPASSPG